MNLVCAMVVKDEADRYLTRVMDDIQQYADTTVVLDDGSTDNTLEVVETYPDTHTYTNHESTFWQGENRLREQLWRYILPRHCERGDWVIAIDADELTGKAFKDPDLRDKLLLQKTVHSWSFQIYEAWSHPEKIRVDGTWNPHGKHTPLLVRWLPQVNYAFPPLQLHGGRVPYNQPGPSIPAGHYLHHLGWADPDDIPVKIKRYTSMDKNPNPWMREHYQSMTREPLLVDWWLE